MKGQAVVHSKGKDDWRTPAWLFQYFNSIYNFGLDAAADGENSLCEQFFSMENSALTQSWKGYGNVFVNPPYSLNQKFIEHIIDEFDGTFYIVALVPSRTDTKWWHDYVMYAAENIYFIKGRLKFSNSENSAPFPSSAIVFRTIPEQINHCPIIHSLEKPKNVRHKPACSDSRTAIL